MNSLSKPEHNPQAFYVRQMATNEVVSGPFDDMTGAVKSLNELGKLHAIYRGNGEFVYAPDLG